MAGRRLTAEQMEGILVAEFGRGAVRAVAGGFDVACGSRKWHIPADRYASIPSVLREQVRHFRHVAAKEAAL